MSFGCYWSEVLLFARGGPWLRAAAALSSLRRREGCAEEAASASFQPCELRQGASLLQASPFLSVKWDARDPYTIISR